MQAGGGCEQDPPACKGVKNMYRDPVSDIIADLFSWIKLYLDNPASDLLDRLEKVEKIVDNLTKMAYKVINSGAM